MLLKIATRARKKNAYKICLLKTHQQKLYNTSTSANATAVEILVSKFLVVTEIMKNKKTVLSQGNRAMPQLFFFGLKFADNIRKPGFIAPNTPAQNRI